MLPVWEMKSVSPLSTGVAQLHGLAQRQVQHLVHHRASLATANFQNQGSDTFNVFWNGLEVHATFEAV